MTERDEPFLWGVSTSGYQSEGGFNGPGQPQNNWAEGEQSGRYEKTGRASEFWTRYREDFARCRKMGLNGFRMGIEWARVQPATSTRRTEAAPEFDFSAIDAYADRIFACRAAGLEAVVTLQHFTHPAWLGTDAWLEDRTVEFFAAYVRTVVLRLNERLAGAFGAEPVRYYITLNEPNILNQNTYLSPTFPGSHWGPAVAVRALNRLLAAHVRAYNEIHDLYEARGWRRPMVTTNTFCSDLYWSDQGILDLLSYRERGERSVESMAAREVARLNGAIRDSELPFREGLFVWLGRIAHRVIDFLFPRYFTTERFRFFLGVLGASKRPRVFDYIGLDYYDPFAGHMFRPPSFGDLEFPTRSLRAWLMDGITSKWWDWRMLPEGLHFFCHYYTALYGRPLLIAENGMALRLKSDNAVRSARTDRTTRSEFLRSHLPMVRKLREEGCPLLGYFHWSLTDNYEWGSFTPRFGLLSLDYATGTGRLVEDYLGDRPSETYAKLIAETERELHTPQVSAAGQ